MKYVQKQQSPSAFDKWKALQNEEWTPTYSQLQNPQKQALHEALLAEQGGVCCYCGREVTLVDSYIEHFRPQSSYNDLALCYENLHVSCIRETEPGLPLHCGHAKDNAFDEKRCISPLEPTCEQRFRYNQDGKIDITDKSDISAEYMRCLLKLNIDFLCNRRAEVLKRTFDAEFIETMTVNDLQKMRDAFRLRNEQGCYVGFGHVVARYAEQCLTAIS